MDQATIGLLILLGVFFLGYGASYLLQVRPSKAHIVWLNNRLEDEHRRRMELMELYEAL